MVRFIEISKNMEYNKEKIHKKGKIMALTWKNCLKIGVTALLLFVCIYYFKSFSNLLSLVLSALIPVLAGLLIAFLLNILMSFYEKHYFPKSNKKIVKVTRRPVCLVAALLSFLFIIAAVVWLVIPELVSCVKFIVSETPGAISKFLQSGWVQKAIPAETLAQLTQIDWSEVINKTFSALQNGFTDIVSTVVTAVTSIVSSVITVFLSIVFAIYILFAKEKIKAGLSYFIKGYAKEKHYNNIAYCAEVVNESFRGYIIGQCTEAVILGTLCIIGMWIFRLPYAVMIGTLVGFTALIPVAGAYIGAAIGALMILTVSPIKALVFIIFLIILQQLEGNLIYPRVVGKTIGIPSILVLLAVTVGGGVAGVAGMLLGVPLVASVYRIVKEDLDKRKIKA